MAQADRRTQQRVPVQLKIIYVHDGDYLISHSKDLSVDGMFIYTPKPLPVGETTEISFALNDHDEFIVRARVAWVNPSASEAEAGIGVQFIDPPAPFKETILQTVKRIAVLVE